jgi:apolipoprotein D and lipocalin family protein
MMIGQRDRPTGRSQTGGKYSMPAAAQWHAGGQKRYADADISHGAESPENMNLLRIIPLALLVTGLAGCGGTDRPLPVVDQVDLERYTGTWHEIARLPQWFQRGCYNSTARYSLTEGGAIKVVNRCQRAEKPDSKAVGEATVVPGSGNAKLRVRFDNWFSRLFPTITTGNYWIIHLDADYQVVMIGEPKREYLWILARQPELPEDTYLELVNKAEELGFPVSELKRNRELVPDESP